MSPVPVARSSAARAGARRRQIDEPPLPAPVLSVRQGDGDEIVAIGNRRKQRAHVAALAVRRRDAIARAAHAVSSDNIACMLPSSTVENYLKAIYQGQSALPRRTAARADGTGGIRARRHARHGDDDGEGAGGVGPGRVRTVQRRAADGGRREARRPGAPPPSARRAVSRAR